MGRIDSEINTEGVSGNETTSTSKVDRILTKALLDESILGRVLRASGLKTLESVASFVKEKDPTTIKSIEEEFANDTF